MKVVYILAINWGGIPHYTAELANAVSRYADVTVIKPNDSNDDLFSENVKVVNAFKPANFSTDILSKLSLRHIIQNLPAFLSYKNIYAIIKKYQPDIIHITENTPYLSFFAYLQKIDQKYPTVCTIHLAPKSVLLSPTKYGWTKSFISSISILMTELIRPEKIIVHTDEDKNILIQRGFDSRKIAIIPHGAYTLFKKYDKNKSKNEENCILFFGHITENKGVEYLLRAVPIISKEIPNIKIIIAGKGDFSKYSKYMTNKSKFEIYNEFIPTERVPELFSRAKIVVLPYIAHRGHSGVLTIAFSFGKPVVVTNVGSLPELVKNGREGLVVPPRDPKALADAIIKILEDEKLRKKMSKNALKRAEKLSWDNIAKMHIRVYEEVLRRWKPEM